MRRLYELSALTCCFLLGWGVRDAGAQTTCAVTAAARALPAEVRETSGLARGRTNPDVFWTHNDSGNQPLLYAINSDGRLQATVPLNVRFTDWEDIEAAACGTENCLYLADIGDNSGRRAHVSIHEVLEPDLPARAVTLRRTITARYDDGPQDAEALVRLASGEMLIVTKGRQKAIKLYRLVPGTNDGQARLQLVRELGPRPTAETDRVTAATVTPDGNWVAIRSYGTLYLYRTASLLAGAEPAMTYSLAPLAEKQGESISLDNDGTVWLTSEAERRQDTPTIAGLKCELPQAR